MRYFYAPLKKLQYLAAMKQTFTSLMNGTGGSPVNATGLMALSKQRTGSWRSINSSKIQKNITANGKIR